MSKPSAVVAAPVKFESEYIAPIFHLSLSEWQDEQGIECNCGDKNGVSRFHRPTCDVVLSVAEWRVLCHTMHERIRDTFPRLIETKECWWRETEQMKKDRERITSASAS